MTNTHRHRARAPLMYLLASVALLGAGGCHKKEAPTSSVTSIVASDQDNRVPGPVTVEAPARTGSQASGTEGSSTVIGAPPKGQTSTTSPAH